MSKLTNSEQQVYKKVLNAKNSIMTEGGLKTAFPGMNGKELQLAVTSLLGKRLFGPAGTRDGQPLYKAMALQGANNAQAALTEEQTLVYNFIKRNGNKGLSTSQMARELGSDQISTLVLRKAVSTLEQNKMIKAFKPVTAPTLSLYIAYNMEPPENLVGGIWYDKGSYDESLVDELQSRLYEKVRSITFPKHRSSTAAASCENPILPVHKMHLLPSPNALLAWLRSSRITNIDLKARDVMELMRALEFDGKIEVLKPADGMANDAMDLASADEGQSGDEGGERSGSGSAKRKHEDDDPEDENEAKRRKKEAKERQKEKDRKAAERKAKEALKKKRKKEKERRKKEKELIKKELKKKKKKDREKKERSKSKSKAPGSDDELRAVDSASDVDSDSSSSSSSSASSSSSDSSSNSSDAGSASSGSLDGPKPTRKRPSKMITRTNAPAVPTSSRDVGDGGINDLSNENVVYRAVREWTESVPLGMTQAPCGHCPMFEFCQDDGPVNPVECQYLEGWIDGTKGGFVGERTKGDEEDEEGGQMV